MKKQISILALAVISSVTACNKPAGSKEEQLQALKQEQAELAEQIAALEAELKAAGGKTEAAQKTVPVAIITVQADTFNHYLEVQGRIDFDQNVSLSAKVPGVLTSVRAKAGDKVAAGQVLATIDAAVLQQNIEELKTRLDLAQTVYQKQKNLWDQKIGTEIQYLTARNNKESLEKSLVAMQRQYDQYSIKAPISGVVDAFTPKVGEAVSPGMPIGRVVNMSESKVVAELSEAYAHKVKPGDNAKVFFPDLNEEIETKVKVVGQAIDPGSRTFTLELGLSPAARKQVSLRPNMIAIVRVNDYSKPNAIAVPVNLVQKDEQSSFVYAVKEQNGKAVAQKVPVNTGRTYKDKIEILSGLAPNDKVISAGYQSLNEGQPVVYEQRAAAQ